MEILLGFRIDTLLCSRGTHTWESNTPPSFEFVPNELLTWEL